MDNEEKSKTANYLSTFCQLFVNSNLIQALSFWIFAADFVSDFVPKPVAKD